jgi:hydrogenase maturation protease
VTTKREVGPAGYKRSNFGKEPRGRGYGKGNVHSFHDSFVDSYPGLLCSEQGKRGKQVMTSITIGKPGFPYLPDADSLMRSRIRIIGLGNILLRDEGVGVHVLDALKERYTFSPPIELIDGGTMGLDLLPFFEGADKVLILDAVDFGREPGYIEKLEDHHIPAVFSPKLSVHHIGLSDVLFATTFMGIKPGEICLVGIQPQSIEIGLEMTEQIRTKVEGVIDLVLEKLKEWDVTCALQSP